jgi:hypothetical protein
VARVSCECSVGSVGDGAIIEPVVAGAKKNVSGKSDFHPVDKARSHGLKERHYII